VNIGPDAYIYSCEQDRIKEVPVTGKLKLGIIIGRLIQTTLLARFKGLFHEMDLVFETA
jgi:hypothetical protein